MKGSTERNILCPTFTSAYILENQVHRNHLQRYMCLLKIFYSYLFQKYRNVLSYNGVSLLPVSGKSQEKFTNKLSVIDGHAQKCSNANLPFLIHS